MIPSSTAQLMSALEALGWTVDAGFAYAPNRTMWLDVTSPWPGSAEDFRERMAGRAQRFRSNMVGATGEALSELQRGLEDVVGLLRALDELPGA